MFFILFFIFINASLSLAGGLNAFELYFTDTDSHSLHERTFTPERKKVFPQIFHTLNPNISFHQVVIDTEFINEKGKETGKSYSTIVEKIISEKVKEVEGQIDFLILSDHGSTTHYLSQNSETRFSHASYFSETGVGFKLQRILTPFKPKLKPDLKIILNACNTMSGLESRAIKRASSLLSFLGTPSGTIYGSPYAQYLQTYDYPQIFKNDSINKKTADYLLAPVFGLLVAVSTLGIVDISSTSEIDLLKHFEKFWPIYVSLFVLPIFKTREIRTILMHFIYKKLNVGKLYVFKEGKFIKKSDLVHSKILINPLVEGRLPIEICKIFLSK